MVSHCKAIVVSFTCLTGSPLSQEDIIPSLNCLNATIDEDDENALLPTTLSQNDLLQIIRHNAFGPDGLHSYQKMEHALQESTSSLSTTPSTLQCANVA